MNEQKRHSVSVSTDESLSHQVVEEGGVGGQTDDHQDGVDCDGYDLGFTKLHVIRKTEV